MNTEDFVTYKQALALKKHGFDLEVNHVYDKNGELREEGMNENVDCDYTAYFNYNKSGYIEVSASAPTLAQAQKWFRQKGYSIETMLCVDKTYRCDIFNIEDFQHVSFKVMPSYEEALSAGITECIKLLTYGSINK